MKSKTDNLHFTILNMGTDQNKGDLAIIETTVRLLKMFSGECIINALNVNYSKKVINSKVFKYFDQLVSKHIGAIFPRVFDEKNVLLNLLNFIKNLCLSFWMLFSVYLFKKRAGFLLMGSQKESFNEIIKSDVLVLKGGSYLFCYGGIKQELFLFRMIYTSLISVILKKRLLILGHSIGPVYGLFPNILVKYVLRKSEKIVVREDITYSFIVNNLKIEKSKVILFPDLAFWFDKEEMCFSSQQLKDILKNEKFKHNLNCSIKVGLTVRYWNFPRSLNPKALYMNYLDSIAGFLDNCATKHNVEFFIMPHTAEDKVISLALIKKIKCAKPIILDNDYSTFTLRKLYGMMDVFVGTRIHSCIFAISQNVPTLAIAYEIPKGFGIVGMFEGENYIIDIRNVTAQLLSAKFNSLLQELELIKKELDSKVDLARRQIENGVLDILIKMFN